MPTIDYPSADDALDDLSRIPQMTVSVVHPEHHLGIKLQYEGNTEENPLNFYDPQGRQNFFRRIEPLLPIYDTIECTGHKADLQDPETRIIALERSPRLDLLHGHDDVFLGKELRAIIFRKNEGCRPATAAARLEDIMDDIDRKLKTYLRLAFFGSGQHNFIPPNARDPQPLEYLQQVEKWQKIVDDAKEVQNLSTIMKRHLGNLLHHAHLGLHIFEDLFRRRSEASDFDFLALDQQERLVSEQKIISCEWPEHTDHTFIVGALPTVHGKLSTREIEANDNVATLFAFPVTRDVITDSVEPT